MKSDSQNKIFQEALDWEASKEQLLKKSEFRAWTIAGAFGILVILSWIAIVLMMPLKQTVPFVIRVNKTTGVPDIVKALNDKRISYDDVLDKYWLATYIRARETYDWYTLQKDYDTVGLLSSKPVGSEYAKLFQGSNALDKTFGSSIRMNVEILSVVPNGKGIATIRFIKTTKRTSQEGFGDSQTFVATLSYQYKNPSHMKESLRLVNPFGFQVMSYRVDPEFTGGQK